MRCETAARKILVKSTLKLERKSLPIRSQLSEAVAGYVTKCPANKTEKELAYEQANYIYTFLFCYGLSNVRGCNADICGRRNLHLYN